MQTLRTAGFATSSIVVALSVSGGATTSTAGPGNYDGQAKFEFVSQTFDGNVTTKSSIPGLPSPPAPTLGTAYLGVDMERVAMRSDQHIVMDQKPVPTIHVTSDVMQSKIFDVKTKRITTYQKQTTATTIDPNPPTPPTTKTICEYFEFPGLKDAAEVKTCLAAVASMAKPVSSEDGLQKFEFEFNTPSPAGPGAPAANATTKEVIYTDASFVIKKMVADSDVQVKPGQDVVSHTELTALKSKAGAPDSSMFEIPAEWGTCAKSTMPFDPSQVTGPLKVLIQCMGVGAVEHEAVIV